MITDLREVLLSERSTLLSNVYNVIIIYGKIRKNISHRSICINECKVKRFGRTNTKMTTMFMSQDWGKGTVIGNGVIT